MTENQSEQKVSYISTNPAQYSGSNLASLIGAVPDDFIGFDGYLHAPKELITTPGRISNHSLIRVAQPLAHGNSMSASNVPLFHPIVCDRGSCGDRTNNYCGFYMDLLRLNPDAVQQIFGDLKFEEVLISKAPCGIYLDHSPNGVHVRRFLQHYLTLGYTPEKLEVLSSQVMTFDGWHDDFRYYFGPNLRNLPSAGYSPEVMNIDVAVDGKKCQIDFSWKPKINGDKAKLQPQISLVESFGFELSQ